MSDLRYKAIKLAYEKKELRKDLLPLLKQASREIMLMSPDGLLSEELPRRTAEGLLSRYDLEVENVDSYEDSYGNEKEIWAVDYLPDFDFSPAEPAVDPGTLSERQLKVMIEKRLPYKVWSKLMEKRKQKALAEKAKERKKLDKINWSRYTDHPDTEMHPDQARDIARNLLIVEDWAPIAKREFGDKALEWAADNIYNAYLDSR